MQSGKGVLVVNLEVRSSLFEKARRQAPLPLVPGTPGLSGAEGSEIYPQVTAWCCLQLLFVPPTTRSTASSFRRQLPFLMNIL